MKTYQVYQVDSFTREKFRGNPAGVVPHADGLTEEDMVKIAREMNNSETAFIFSPEGPDHDVHIRYFTPTIEVPICGHATIAAHYVRAVTGQLSNCTVRQKSKVGILPVEIVHKDDDYSVIMTQGAIQFGDIIEGELRAELVGALGITEAEMDQRCPIQIVSTGHSKVMVGIGSRSCLDGLAPDMTVLKKISAMIGCNGFFVFTLDSGMSGVLTHGRMFAPAIGIQEDPVTGNANGPLGAYLVRYGLTPYDGKELRFRGEQGSAIGRSGIIDVAVAVDQGEPVQVRIGGPAVVVFATEISL